MKKIFITFFCSFLFIRSGFTGDYSIEHIGDVLQLMIPSYALGLTMKEKDYTGTKQLLTGYGATLLSEYLLKKAVHEERPNKANFDSFPSGHTASAFSGATFIHKRYGIKSAIIPYILASFVGYSRIYSKWHHPHDVLAGAVIAGAYTWIFTDRENPVTISADTTGARIDFKTSF